MVIVIYINIIIDVIGQFIFIFFISFISFIFCIVHLIVLLYWCMSFHIIHLILLLYWYMTLIYIIMRHNMIRQRVDPVLAPDQFSVARPLRPGDLDRCVTQYGIYPSLPAPNGAPWSECVRTHRNRSRSVSSSTEALESDHARYVTRRIVQHTRSMATST